MWSKRAKRYVTASQSCKLQIAGIWESRIVSETSWVERTYPVSGVNAVIRWYNRSKPFPHILLSVNLAWIEKSLSYRQVYLPIGRCSGPTRNRILRRTWKIAAHRLCYLAKLTLSLPSPKLYNYTRIKMPVESVVMPSRSRLNIFCLDCKYLRDELLPEIFQPLSATWKS